MKRCPQCGREYDATMMFCLDDGAELLYGPTSGGETPTAMLSEFSGSPSGEVEDNATTRVFAEKTVEANLPATIRERQSVAVEGGNRKAFDKRLLLAPIALAVIALAGF